MKNLFIKILRLLVVVLVLVSGSLGCVIFEDTLAPWWIPVGMALAVAALTFPFYKKWRWLTENESKTLNLICHFLCVGAVAYVLFLAGNFSLADANSTKEVTVTVLKKYVEQHKKRHKVGKHRYVSDGIRKEYYIEVMFEDGTVKALHVSVPTFNKAQKGKPKTLVMQKGFFGLPIVRKGL